MKRGTTSPMLLPPLTPGSRALMIAIGGIFLVQVVIRVVLGFDSFRYAGFVDANVGLSAAGIFDEWKLWTLFTWYWFSDLSSVFNVILSILMIWIFGPALETRVGIGRTVAAFFFAGFLSGLATLGISLLAGPESAVWNWTLIGAAGATSGLAAFLFWLERKTTFHVFIAEARGLQLLAFFAVLHVLQGLLSHPIAAAAPLGGMLAGILSASGKDPWRLYQQFKLWRIRRRVRLISGGKDDRDFLH